MTTRSRAGSTTDPVAAGVGASCAKCKKKTGDNWIGCDVCGAWLHIDCTGISKDDFIVIRRNPGLLWCCDFCLPSAKAKFTNTSSNELRFEKVEKKMDEVISLVKEFIEKPTANERKMDEVISHVKEFVEKPNLENFNADNRSTPTEQTDHTRELRIAGIPEYACLTTSDKARRIDIFSHEEKSIGDVLNHLGVDRDTVASAFRLGPFNRGSQRPRTLVVRFNNEFTVNKILARSSMLSTFKGNYRDSQYDVFISKSLTRAEQSKEKMALKKRRELIDSGVDAKTLKVRNGELRRDGEKVATD